LTENIKSGFACSNKYRINTNYHILNIYRIFARHPKEVQSNGITHVLNLAVEDDPFHMLPVELWDSNFKSSSLPVDRKYQKWQSRDNYIILLFNILKKCNQTV
jgi:endo-1,4-beta-D-glucanase Y